VGSPDAGAFSDSGSWVEEPDGIRVYGVWYIPHGECDTPIVLGKDEFPPDWCAGIQREERYSRGFR
jgi:hypothetical protein